MGEAFVIKTELMQHGRVQIANVHWVLGDIVGEIVCLAVGDAGFYAAARQPHAEAAGVVIATVVLGFQVALRVDGTAKFSAPDYEGIIQHAATFEVGD